MREYLILAGLAVSLPCYCWALATSNRFWPFWFAMLGIFGVGMIAR